MRKNKLVRRVIAVCPKYLGKSVAGGEGEGVSPRPGRCREGLSVAAPRAQGPSGVALVWG